MKTTILAAAVLAAGAALAGQAGATTLASCTPTNDIEITFKTVNAFETTRAYRAIANGVVVGDATIAFRRPGTAITIDLPTPTGPVSVQVLASVNFQAALQPIGSFECGVPTPAPEPPGEVTPPPVVTPPPPPPPPPPVVTPPAKATCAGLIKAGAGRKWLVKYRCANRLPVSCKVLKKVGAGPLTYARAGYYYRCAKAPVPRRTTPAVTG